MAAKKKGKKKMGGGGGGKGPASNIVVGSKVKDAVRNAGVRSAGDLVDALNSKVHRMLSDAVERCKANGRGTVRPQDL
jgi:hypothetical protein